VVDLPLLFTSGGASVVPFGAKYTFCRICAASSFNVKGVVNRSSFSSAAFAAADKYLFQPKRPNCAE